MGVAYISLGCCRTIKRTLLIDSVSELMLVQTPNLLKTAIGNDNSRNLEFSNGQNGRGRMTMFPHLKNLAPNENRFKMVQT